jgi:hypothetical protein
VTTDRPTNSSQKVSQLVSVVLADGVGRTDLVRVRVRVRIIMVMVRVRVRVRVKNKGLELRPWLRVVSIEGKV